MKPILSIFFTAFFLLIGIAGSNAATKDVSAPVVTAANVGHEGTTYQFASCLDGKDDFYSLQCSRLLKKLWNIVGLFPQLYW